MCITLLYLSMPVELSFVIPFTVIMAGIIAVFFWAFSGRKKAQLEESQRAQTEATAAAAAPPRGRVKWSAAAAANAQEDDDEGNDGQPRAAVTKKQQIKMQRADEVKQLQHYIH